MHQNDKHHLAIDDLELDQPNKLHVVVVLQ
jgi:hypothetical protein